MYVDNNEGLESDMTLESIIINLYLYGLKVKLDITYNV